MQGVNILIERNFNSVQAYGYFLLRKSDNKKYVGIRYANVKLNLTPNQDFGKVYFTSGKLKTEFKENPDNFTYRVVRTFKTLDDMWDWEKKVVLRVYKRHDWANQGWGPNYGDNPEIGRLISEGRNKKLPNGKTPNELGSESFKRFLDSEQGEVYLKELSLRQYNKWKERSPEQRKEISDKRKAKMDFKAASAKSVKKRKEVGEDGLTSYQRSSISITMKNYENGTFSSENMANKNEQFNKKLGEMSDDEFKSFCDGKTDRIVKGWITRRNKYLLSQSNELT
jgi:hypothetical protein